MLRMRYLSAFVATLPMAIQHDLEGAKVEQMHCFRSDIAGPYTRVQPMVLPSCFVASCLS